jgi:hypothetical protein
MCTLISIPPPPSVLASSLQNMTPAAHDVKALLAHIEKLEKKLQYYERHHQCCPHIVALSPPADEEIDLDHDLSGLKVIPFFRQRSLTFEATKFEPAVEKDFRSIAERRCVIYKGIDTQNSRIRIG